MSISSSDVIEAIAQASADELSAGLMRSELVNFGPKTRMKDGRQRIMLYLPAPERCEPEEADRPRRGNGHGLNNEAPKRAI